MQKVTSILPSWDKTKSGGKAGFDKVWKGLDKLGAPVNRWTNKIGSEAFWPTTLDKESDKAARILKTFCKDGFYVEEDRPLNQDGAKGKQRVLKKIPQKVIANAVGLAIFTTMRSGLWISGAGGSGVLIARQENGEWSPPSGILLHTAGLGFLVGVDIYDCVVVINNRKALDSFTKIRATLGGEISAVAGPFGIGGVLENDGKWKQANRPVFTYLKSRGFYAGVQVDGTVIIERTDENERFYGEKIGVADIIAGKARHPPYEIKMLMETVKAAEGRTDVDQDLIRELDNQPAPADLELESPSNPIFGIPEPDDPDPFGVLALEREGMEIREAGTKNRPPSTIFDFNPSPTSPIYSKFHRRSMDTLVTKSNRDSIMSNRSVRTRTSVESRGMQTMDFGTQTDDLSSASRSDEDRRIEEEDERQAIEPPEIDYTKIDLGPYSDLNHNQDLDGSTVNESPLEHDASYTTEDEDDEEPVIFEAASAQATILTPQTIKARGGLVNIPKRPPPPPLPPRNIRRTSHGVMVDQASGMSPVRSPSREGFEDVDLHGVDRKGSEETKEGEVTKGSEETNGIVVPGLVEKDPAPKTPSLDEKLALELEEVPLEKFESTGAETIKADTINGEIEESTNTTETIGHKDDGNETDDFHSLPTTPLEVK